MSLDWQDLFPHIAHDVRALVRKGLSNAQFLEKRLAPITDPEIAGHIRAIIESQRDLSNLFVRLVTLVEALPGVPRSGVDDFVPLEVAFLGAKNECGEAMMREGVELESNPFPDCNVPRKTQVVLRELIENSLRFREPSRTLRISIEAKEHSGRLSVRITDNGVGVDHTYANGLFQPFQRMDARRSGFGLGLAISRAIVEGAGGSIYLETSGAGAVFVFELPVVLV